VQVDWAIICNAAEGPPSGLVYILGAGVDTLVRPQYPSHFMCSLVVRLLAARAEADRPHTLELQCNDEDGRSILPEPIVLPVGPLAIPDDLPVGWSVSVNLVANLQSLPLPSAGRYSFEMLLDGEHKRSLPFRAVYQPGAGL
jgi:hypothetical protein